MVITINRFAALKLPRGFTEVDAVLDYPIRHNILFGRLANARQKGFHNLRITISVAPECSTFSGA
jgi:hypothetical protein